VSGKHTMTTEEYDNPIFHRGMQEIFANYVITTMRKFYAGDSWIDVLVTSEDELDEDCDVHGSPGRVFYRISGFLANGEETELCDRPSLDGARKIVRAFGCNA